MTPCNCPGFVRDWKRPERKGGRTVEVCKNCGCLPAPHMIVLTMGERPTLRQESGRSPCSTMVKS